MEDRVRRRAEDSVAGGPAGTRRAADSWRTRGVCSVRATVLDRAAALCDACATSGANGAVQTVEVAELRTTVVATPSGHDRGANQSARASVQPSRHASEDSTMSLSAIVRAASAGRSRDVLPRSGARPAPPRRRAGQGAQQPAARAAVSWTRRSAMRKTACRACRRVPTGCAQAPSWPPAVRLAAIAGGGSARAVRPHASRRLHGPRGRPPASRWSRAAPPMRRCAA